MGAYGSTIECMAKRKKTDRHKPSRMVRLPDALAEPLRDVAEERVTDLTTEVKQAVREYLERLGRWPRKHKGNS